MRTFRIKKVPSYYTSAQARKYLEVIGFPAELIPSEQEIQDGLFPTTLTNLTLIMRLQLIRFPWENLDMHYSPNHAMETDLQKVYETLVVESDKGRGTLCHGHNGMLLGMLRALGYRCYPASGRVNNNVINASLPPLFMHIMHMLLLVQPSPAPTRDEEPDASIPLAETYVVDVGYGIPSLVRPVPLVDGAVVPGSAWPEEHRVVRARHPGSSVELYEAGENPDEDPTLEWRIESRLGARSPNWVALYHFGLQETFGVDHDAACFVVSQRQGPGTGVAGPFWFTVQCTRHFVVEEGAGEAEAQIQAQAQAEGREIPIDSDPIHQLTSAPPHVPLKSPVDIQKFNTTPLGRLVLHGTRVDRRVGDTSTTVASFAANDLARIRILKEYFGVQIPEEWATNIVGRVPALDG